LPKPSGLAAHEQIELGNRIRVLVKAVGTQAEAARVAEVTPRQLSRFMSGQNAPSALPLARLAAKTGISLDWVMSGDGPMTRPLSGIRATDPELLGRVVDGIAKVYEDANVRLPDIDLGRIAATEYDVIVASASDASERRLGVKMSIERIRQRLRGDEAGHEQRA